MGVISGRNGRYVVWVSVGLVVAFVIGIALFRYVGALLFAIFLYYAIRPLYHLIDRYIDHPNLTASVTILAIVLPMVAVVGYAGIVALQELDSFLAASDLEAYRSILDPYLSLARGGDLGAIRETIQTGSGGSLAAALQQGLPAALERAVSVAGFTVSVLANMFLLLTFLFYLLRDDWKIRQWFTRSIGNDHELVTYLDAVDDDLQTVFVGNLAIVGVAASMAVATYLLLNLFVSGGRVVQTPVLLAMLIGIGTLIPVVGMKIVYVPYGLFILGQALTTSVPIWHPIVFFVLTLTIIDTVPDFFARSFLSARSGVHMGLVLLGYFLGTLAFGWYGLFLGPIVVVLAVHYAHTIFPDLASAVLAGDDLDQREGDAKQ